MRGISFHHFALTFDEQNRFIVKDLGSFCGTEVTYDKQGQGKRSDCLRMRLWSPKEQS
jgi:hypothetical protein